MSNAAALRIVAVSTDVLFNTMEDVFITGVCRAVTGIGCTTVPGIPETNKATACDVISGRVINIHHVNSVKQMRLWNFLSNEIAVKQACGSMITTVHLVVCVALLSSIIYCFSTCRRKLLSVIMQRK